ncbi:hypothetical protein DV515_00005786, partial [Chloebia gouldiae]
MARAGQRLRAAGAAGRDAHAGDGALLQQAACVSRIIPVPCPPPDSSRPAHLSTVCHYLSVVDIYMFKEPHEINKQEHHTDKYYNPKLIVRRGQAFQIQIDFNRPYKPESDQFWLEFLM